MEMQIQQQQKKNNQKHFILCISLQKLNKKDV